MLKIKVPREYIEKYGPTLDFELLGEIVVGDIIYYNEETFIAEMLCDYRVGDWEFSNVLLRFMVITEGKPSGAEELLQSDWESFEILPTEMTEVVSYGELSQILDTPFEPYAYAIAEELIEDDEEFFLDL